VDVLRGTTLNAYGDEVPGTTPAVSGVPMSLIERTRLVRDPSTGELRRVAYVAGRCKADTDIRESDRIRDARTGVVYMVLGRRTAGSIVGLEDLELDLLRATQDR
jgi:hypothetical protein